MKKFLIAIGLASSCFAWPSQARVIVDLEACGIGHSNTPQLTSGLAGSKYANTYLSEIIADYNKKSGNKAVVTIPMIAGKAQKFTLVSGEYTPSILSSLGKGTWDAGKLGHGKQSFVPIDLGSSQDYTYLVGQWGGNGGYTAVYYIKGLMGTLDLKNDLSKAGLTKYWLVKDNTPAMSVPDGGATIALCGLGLLAVAGVRRFALRRAN
jgi:hypothetical protein